MNKIDANNPGYSIYGTAGGSPATMSVFLEDREVEILAPPFFRIDEKEAFALADLLVRQFLPITDYHPGVYGWWSVDNDGAYWRAPLSAWNPDNEIDDGK